MAEINPFDKLRTNGEHSRTINKKSLEHLADLVRIELKAGEEERFLKDLEKILAYFQELQQLNTDNVTPMTGGTELKSVFREDEKTRDKSGETRRAVQAFPEEEKGYLKVPPIFE